MSRDLNIAFYPNDSSRKDDIVNSIAKLLLEIIEENKSNNKSTYLIIILDEKQSNFDAFSPPTLNIKEYIERIVLYTKTEESSIILALIYVDRMCEKMKIQLSSSNIYK